MHNYLQEILVNKAAEIQRLKQQNEFAEVRYTRNKSFKKALQNKHGLVIAEIKRRSPSKLQLAKIEDPIQLAKRYLAGGSAAISVLTDQFGFNGCLADLKQIATACNDQSCAILRKDFIIDSVQIDESIAAGADAVLLIVSILQEKTVELFRYAQQRGIDVVIEVHNKSEIDFALKMGAAIIGVNNRNLTTFTVDLNHAKKLIRYIPDDVIKIAESGINSPHIANEFIQLGYDAVLIGEALVKTNYPEKFIQAIVGRK